MKRRGSGLRSENGEELLVAQRWTDDRLDEVPDADKPSALEADPMLGPDDGDTDVILLCRLPVFFWSGC